MARILLIEDDADVRLMMEHALIDADHKVDTASTMAAGVELLDTGDYDLVIADAKLPDGSGVDVADKAADRSIRALIITGYAFTLPAGTILRFNILLKPLRPAEIIYEVQRALSAP